MPEAEFREKLGKIHPETAEGASRWVPSDQSLKARIAQIKAMSKTGGMEPDEYFHVMRYVRDNAPQRLLIWGLGYDSATYEQLNRGGTTDFLEFDVSWVGKADAATQKLNYSGYDDRAFRTSVATVDAFIKQPHRAMNIPLLAARQCFDTVIVDSPLGWTYHNTGRAVPLYTAATDLRSCIRDERYKADRNVTIFVHDCFRAGEEKLTRAFLGEPTTQVGPKRLREFRLQQGALNRLRF